MGQASSLSSECVAHAIGETARICSFDPSRTVTALTGNAFYAAPCRMAHDRSRAANGNLQPSRDVCDSCTPSRAYRHADTSCCVTMSAANDQPVVPDLYLHRYLSPSCRVADNDNHDRSDELDQFYTKRAVASRLYGVFRTLYDPMRYQMVDPSAGDGAFYSILPPGTLGIDRDPKYPGIFAADFLERDLSSWLGRGKPVAVIGNPPFGCAASMAVRFFNHAARCADVEVIALILPLSVRKPAIQNRLDHDFHLMCDMPVPRDAYIFRGRDHNVPTVFQIWQRKATPRAIRALSRRHPDFRFTRQEDADFAIRRNGYHAGRVCGTDVDNPDAFYFIRGRVRTRMADLDFSPFYQNVSGPRSLSQVEIVMAYTERFGSGSKPGRCP